MQLCMILCNLTMFITFVDTRWHQRRSQSSPMSSWSSWIQVFQALVDQLPIADHFLSRLGVLVVVGATKALCFLDLEVRQLPAISKKITACLVGCGIFQRAVPGSIFPTKLMTQRPWELVYFLHHTWESVQTQHILAAHVDRCMESQKSVRN